MLYTECALFSALCNVSQHAFSIWPIKGSITIWPEKAEPDGIQRKSPVEESTLENIIEKGLKGNPIVFLTACPERIYEYLHMIREMGPLWIRYGKTDDEGIWEL